MTNVAVADTTSLNATTSLFVGDCPCINPWVNSQSNCTLESGEDGFKFDTDGLCVSMDFGASCGNYDTEVKALTGQDCTNINYFGEENCVNTKWCFVDHFNCRNIKHDSIESKRGMLSYSFETCGNVNSYRRDKYRSELFGATIRIGYPSDSMAKFDLRTLGNGTKMGSVVDIMQHISKDVGFDVEVVDVSQSSKDRYPGSSYTACVHDVGLGNIDICVGSFWKTPERMIISRFTPDFSNDLMIVVVPNGGNPTLWDLSTAPFAPFTRSAWMWIGGTLVYMSLAMNIIRTFCDSKPSNDEYVAGNGRYLHKSTFTTIFSFTSNGFSRGPVVKSAIEKFIVLGFAIFIFIVVRSYQAGATAVLIETDEILYSSLRDVIDSGERVCMKKSTDAVIGDLVRTAFNFLTDDDMILVERDEMAIKLLDAGECQAFITYVNADKLMRKNSKHYCEKYSITDGHFASLGVSFPVSHYYIDAMSFFISEVIHDGQYNEIADSYMEDIFGDIGACAERSRASEKSVKRSTEELFLPLLCTFLGTSIGLVLFLSVEFKKRLQFHEELKRLKIESSHLDDIQADGDWESRNNAKSFKSIFGNLFETILITNPWSRMHKRRLKAFQKFLLDSGRVDDEIVLRWFVSQASKKDLLCFLQSIDAPSATVSAVLNELPNKEALVELLCFEMSTQKSKIRQELRQINMKSLLKIIGLTDDDFEELSSLHEDRIFMEEDGIDDKVLEALAEDNPCNALVNIIMSDQLLVQKADQWMLDNSKVAMRCKNKNLWFLNNQHSSLEYEEMNGGNGDF